MIECLSYLRNGSKNLPNFTVHSCIDNEHFVLPYCMVMMRGFEVMPFTWVKVFRIIYQLRILRLTDSKSQIDE